jgi:hypothetical protein
MGLKPSPVGNSPWRDNMKINTVRMFDMRKPTNKGDLIRSGAAEAKSAFRGVSTPGQPVGLEYQPAERLGPPARGMAQDADAEREPKSPRSFVVRALQHLMNAVGLRSFHLQEILNVSHADFLVESHHFLDAPEGG